MSWPRNDELSVERDVGDDELAAAVARALGVDRERIAVVARVDEAPAADILVEKRPWPGDFALRVGLYRLPENVDSVALYRVLAAELGCKLLVDDYDVNPYTAVLVTPSGDAVQVDLEARDDDAIVIAGLRKREYAEDEVPDVLTRG